MSQALKQIKGLEINIGKKFLELNNIFKNFDLRLKSYEVEAVGEKSAFDAMNVRFGLTKAVVESSGNASADDVISMVKKIEAFVREPLTEFREQELKDAKAAKSITDGAAPIMKAVKK